MRISNAEQTAEAEASSTCLSVVMPDVVAHPETSPVEMHALSDMRCRSCSRVRGVLCLMSSREGVCNAACRADAGQGLRASEPHMQGKPVGCPSKQSTSCKQLEGC